MEWKLGKKMFSYNLTIKSVERVKRTCYEDSLIFCKNKLEVGFDQESGWVASSFSVVIDYLDMVLLLEKIHCKTRETWKMGWGKHDVDYVIPAHAICIIIYIKSLLVRNNALKTWSSFVTKLTQISRIHSTYVKPARNFPPLWSTITTLSFIY